MHFDSAGVLWIGLATGGLMVQQDDRFVSVDAANGFPENGIFQILSDERGRMWFGSPAGLFHVSRSELLACARNQIERVYPVLMGRSDGLASVSCIGAYQPTSLKSADAKLWFATRQGLVQVDTAAEHLNTQPAPIYINECLIDDRSVALRKGLRIEPGMRKLEMRFSVLSYTAPEKVQVRHLLEGFDSDWVDDGDARPQTGGARHVVFPKLSPGNYRLRIAACNNDGLWNEKAAELAFVVLPAWWQTALFRIVAVIGFAAIVGASVRYWSHRRLRLRLERLEQQQALEKERSRIARDLHDDLGANLTQIALLAEMSSGESIAPERAKSNSAQLSQTARTLVRELDNILWTVNPKNDSLDELATYLCQFSQQFFRITPIRCRFDVAENIPRHPLTPEVRHDVFLVVKEAMNNIAKYSGATEVWLRIAVRDSSFLVEVEDNGSGFDLEEALNSGRNGLKNMRARMEGIGGKLEIEAQPGKGMRLRLSLPLEKTPKQI
jgi:signal transduction histidine kinase